MTTSKLAVAPKALILALAAAFALSLALSAPQALAAELAAGSAVSGPDSTELSTSAARPKASKITSMSFKSNILTIKWKKVAGVDGYQLVYAQRGYFDNVSEVKVAEVTKKRNYKNFFKNCMVKGRTALKGEVLYAKIRTFKIVKGKRVYSAWSKVKPCVARTTWNRTFIAPKNLNNGADLVYFDVLGSAVAKKPKSKNSNIVEATDPLGDGFYLQIKRPGKAAVTFNFLGKKITLKVKAVKWTAPFASLKVGNKNYTKEANNWNSWTPNGIIEVSPIAHLSGKLTVKPAKNWTVTSIELDYGSGKTTKIKNGSTLKRGDYSLIIKLKNKKTGVTTSFGIWNEASNDSGKNDWNFFKG